MRAQVVETFREVGGVLVFVFDDGDAESLVVGSYIGGDGVQVSDYKGWELEGLVLGCGLYIMCKGTYILSLSTLLFHHVIVSVCAAVGADCDACFVLLVALA